MIIESGVGDGRYGLEVTRENMAKTLAVTQTLAHHVNADEGEAYAMHVSVTPTSTTDCFAYIKNTDANDLVVEDVRLWLAASEYIEIRLGEVGTAGGAPTTVVPTNLNAGSGKVASGTFYQDPDITGLSGGAVADRIYHASSAESTLYNLTQYIVVPTNQTLSFYAQTGTTPLYMVVFFYYHTE